jgi:hypothetical protein
LSGLGRGLSIAVIDTLWVSSSLADMMSRVGTDETAFAMVLPRRPISSGSGGKDLFKAAVREAALKLIPHSPRYSAGSLYARVIWFHAEGTTQDVDNIAKRLFDALDGAIYASDQQIVKCALEKVYYTSDAYELTGTAIPDDVFKELVEYLGQRAKHVLYVEVGSMPSRRVVFGPIDGGAG